MRMKKTYLQPWAVVLKISTASIATASGDDTTQEEVHDETIDGDKAWSRPRGYHNKEWDDEEG